MRNYSIIILLLCTTLFASTVYGWDPEWPGGWPVTNSMAACKDLYDGHYDLRTVIACGMTGMAQDRNMPRPEEHIPEYARAKGVPLSDVVHIAATIADEGYAIIHTGQVKKQSSETHLLRYCNSMLRLIGCTKDASAQPYLRKMSRSPNRRIRESGSYALISMMRDNSLSFLQDAALRGKNEEGEMYLLYAYYFSVIEKEKKKDPDLDLDDAYIHFLKLAEKEDAGKYGQLYDRFLCKSVEGYASSIQRKRIAERFAQGKSSAGRPHFAKALKEMKKIPVSELEDFAVRGKLLNPERKRRAKNDKGQSSDN